MLGFNGNRLLAYGKVIAINDSYLQCPNADVLYFGDADFWKNYQYSIRENYLGRRIITLGNQIDGVEALRNTGCEGLEQDPGGLRHGQNSGYAAINLAYHFGVKKIVLLGYDMKLSGDRLHANNRPKSKQTPHGFQRVIKEHFLPHFPTLKQPLAEAGVEVLNATPGSVLTVWPHVNLDEVLRHTPKAA